MAKTVVVSVDGLAEDDKQRIRTAAISGGACIEFVPEQLHGWEQSLLHADVVFGLPPARAIEASNVAFLQLHSSGFEPYKTADLLTRKNFAVANARGVASAAVAEHALSMMFAFSRQVPFHLRNQAAHRWRRASSYRLLQGTTVTIVGMGSIGTALGKVCHALGMQVMGVQRGAEHPDFVTTLFPLDDFSEALKVSQHLVLTLPPIGLKKPLIGPEQFAQMPAGICLYNLGRAALLDYDALEQSLRSGHLAAAGLDVFPDEPLPSSSSLWNMDNVLVSPHAGGRFAGEMSALADLFVDNLERFLTGRPLLNVVICSNPSAN